MDYLPFRNFHSFEKIFYQVFHYIVKIAIDEFTNFAKNFGKKLLRVVALTLGAK